MTTQLTDLQTHWPPIAPLFALRNEDDYDAAVARLNSLLDEIGTNEQHPLYSLLDALGTFIHTYEAEHHFVEPIGGPDVLSYLMDEHGLSAADLSELAPPDAIERFLDGREDLSVAQLRAIALRFRVSPAALLG